MTNSPLLIYDGECTFCQTWINYWQKLTGDAVRYAPFQEVGVGLEFPQIPQENFEKSVQLILPSGEIRQGAYAVFTLLSYAPLRGIYLFLYRYLPGFKFITERLYKWVAAKRSFFALITRFLWGNAPEPPQYIFTRWIFLRVLGIIYAIAFASFSVQALGLIGSGGILPIKEFLAQVKVYLGAKAYFSVPTLFWLSQSDVFINRICIVGIIFSGFLIFGFLTRVSLIFLYILYLSLVWAGQTFMSFQWDMLLLETGFLAIFFAFSSSFVWILRVLLFKLIFLSGAVKLLSGDLVWRGFTALNFHYETQPLPTPIAWYMHQLPLWFQKFSVGFVLFIELMIPFLIFTPRKIRFFAAWAMIFLQALILITGNYTFFNGLAIALCILLFDDQAFRKFIPVKLQKFLEHRQSCSLHFKSLKRGFIGLILTLIISANGFKIYGVFSPKSYKIEKVFDVVSDLHLVNTYGLFAVMTTSRPEIVIEGSNDGEHWLEYEFKYKPGELKKAPKWVAPHQPRLDWQMWFASLGSYHQNPWFVNFAVRLLEGSPEVLKLLNKNPFPNKPPKYIRAVLYDYQFSNFSGRKEGYWWKRKRLELYLPEISLRE